MQDSSSIIDVRPLQEMGARCGSCRAELIGEAYQSEGFTKPVCRTCYKSLKEKRKKAEERAASGTVHRKSVAIPQLEKQAKADRMRPLILGGVVVLLAIITWLVTR